MIIKALKYKIGNFLFWKQDLWLTRTDVDLSTHLTMVKTKPELETTSDEKLLEREKKHKLLANSYTVKNVAFLNEYNEACHTNAFTFKNKNVNHEDEKHLVIFWGGGTSIEGMLSEVHGLISNTNLTIHTFNYPFVNDAIGAVYSHNDLVSCSLAVISALSIPLNKTIFYGDCYGAAVAETTFQELKHDGKKPAGRVLSNSFTHFTGAAHNLIFCNLRMMLFSDPTTTKSFIGTLAVYILLTPIVIPFHLFVMILPLLGWNPKPLETAAQQSKDLWITNRVGDTVLSTATLNKHIKPSASNDWKNNNELLATNASKERSQRFGHQPHFADLSDLGTNEEGQSMYHLLDRFANEACAL